MISTPHQIVYGMNITGRNYCIYGRQERFVQVLVGRPKGKRLLERSTRRWVDNIGMDLQEVG
jgi:hypothetical protein